MSLKRAREYPTKQQSESTDEFAKRLRGALQEEATDRIQDFDILQLANVPWLDVREYGATGDGVTDDTVAIQAALGSGAYSVLFPKGTYLISTALTVSANTYLFGLERTTTKIFHNTDGMDLFYINNVANVIIDNLWLYGYGADSVAGGNNVHVAGTSTGAVVKNCLIEACRRGVLLDTGTSKNKVMDNDFVDIGENDGSTGYGVLVANSDENLVTKNRCSTVRRHGVYLSTAASYNIVTHNTIDGTLNRAISVFSNADESQSPCLYNTINTNVIKSCEDGIGFSQRCGYSEANNNMLEDTTDKAFSVEGHQSQSAITDSPYYIEMANNIVEDAAYGVYVYNGTHIIVDANSLSGISSYGVVLSYTGSTASCYVDYCKVVNNDINGSGTDGVFHAGWARSRYNTVKNNTAFGFTNIMTVASGQQGNIEIPNPVTQHVEGYGTAAPIARTWKVGDTYVNTAPAAGGAPGWRCTTAGTPGTWSARANLAA